MERGAMSYTFRPPLRCRSQPELDERHANDVMKVPKTEEEMDDSSELHDFQNELEYSTIIRNLDPEQRYFLPLSQDSCEIDPVVVEEKFGEDIPVRVGYFIPYGGISVKRAIRTATVADAWYWLRHLLAAFVLLEEANISHNDLHMGNVVVDPSDDLPRIIDFGGAGELELDDGSFDVYRLLMNYRDMIPILHRRFPNSESLVVLNDFVQEQWNKNITPLASELLPLIDETMSSLY